MYDYTGRGANPKYSAAVIKPSIDLTLNNFIIDTQTHDREHLKTISRCDRHRFARANISLKRLYLNPDCLNIYYQFL